MRILHIAYENVAGVPGALVKAERKSGYYSRLITFFRSPKSHWDDIVMNLPFSNTLNMNPIKKAMRIGTYKHEYREGKPPLWNPKSVERFAFLIRDILWDFRIHPIMDFIRSFDCYFLDGGLGFLRNGKIIESLKKSGKKIAVLYLGSDLRVRGILPHIEKYADAIFTTEFDHTFIHPDVKHIMFPYEVDRFKQKEILKNDRITICHAPTNRYLKGTRYLINALENLKRRYDFDFLLMEDYTHEEVIKLKQERCDVLVDQLTDLGGFGYGMNSLECLSMGIPCITYMNPEYNEYLPEHPFLNANKDNIEDILENILQDPAILIDRGRRGREWVKSKHNSIEISKEIMRGLED